MALYNLGEVQIGRGKIDAARRELAEALRLSRRMGDRRRLAYTLSGVARLTANQSDTERAAHFEAVARVAIAAIGARQRRRPLAEDVLPESVIARVVELETTGAIDGATLEQTTDACLAWLKQPPRVGERRVQRTSDAPDGLTRRERDFVGLLCGGLTNRQIAEALVVTEGTAENTCNVCSTSSALAFSRRSRPGPSGAA
jgi:ATP/maltotriose-dependent transcriptional regulator MalT